MKLDKTRENVEQLKRITRGVLNNKVIIRKLDGHYRLEERGKQLVHEGFTQKITALKAK